MLSIIPPVVPFCCSFCFPLGLNIGLILRPSLPMNIGEKSIRPGFQYSRNPGFHRSQKMATSQGRSALYLFVFLLILPWSSYAYRPGDVVPMSRMGQYHSFRTVWHDMISRHCPIFAVNREVLVPLPKPEGYTGADAYKISFQVGREKFLIPWLLVINRKSQEVPMIEVHLRYSGTDLHGITAKVVDMPHHYVDIHPDIKKQFWDSQHWPKHVLVRYTWEEQSEIDVATGFYVLFGSGLLLSFVLSIYVLQSSREKLTRFVMETVAESNISGGVAKFE